MANKEERIAGIIRKSITEIITMELKNPHLGFVTIPEVKVSKDFSYAKVYVSFMFENEIEKVCAVHVPGWRAVKSFHPCACSPGRSWRGPYLSV